MPTTTPYVELKGAQASLDNDGSSLCFTLLLAVVALASGIANGYNGTVLEGAIPRLQFQGQMLAPLDLGLMEGALSLGGLLGSLLCSELATALSRRSLVVFGEATIVTGVLLFATVGSVGTFAQALIGRTLTGVGIAVCGLAKPLIVSELAPPVKRGLLVSFFAVGQSLGMNVFFLTDWALPPQEIIWAWRVLVLLGAMPAVAVICLAFAFREDRGYSPSGYWDVPQRQKVGSGAEGSAPVMLRRMLTKEPPLVRRNFGLIIALMVGYNLSGTLVISNYASDILGDTTRRLPVVIGLVQLAGLLSGATLADKVGRRPLLISSCGLAALSLLAMAGLLGLHQHSTETSAALGLHHHRGPAHHHATGTALAEMWVLLVLMMTVEYAVGAGLNPVRIVLSAELMPNTYRGLGMSLGNASGWLLALISLFLYPVVSAAVGGPAPQFAAFGCVVASLTALLAWQLPETKGIDFTAHADRSLR